MNYERFDQILFSILVEENLLNNERTELAYNDSEVIIDKDRFSSFIGWICAFVEAEQHIITPYRCTMYYRIQGRTMILCFNKLFGNMEDLFS